MRSIRFIVIVFLLFFPTLTLCATVSPNDFGFREAKSDIERYWALYRAHCNAVSTNQDVSYLGMKDFTIEVPRDGKTIPLCRSTDFHGVTITVINNNEDNIYLFSLIKETQFLSMPQGFVDKGDYSSIKQLATGLKLLIIVDKTPWVKKRAGYDYGATRSDILLLEDGIAKNTTIMPYGNLDISTPEYFYTDTDNDYKLITNLHLIRSSKSTSIIRCFKVEGFNNVRIDNITLTTPWDTRLYGDAAISIGNCTNVSFSNVTIDGSYSQRDKYGYGVVLNNVWNSKFYRFKGDAPWGIFGNWNVNNCLLEKCDINRFDIHCYGKDIYFKDCTLRDNYSQFSSVYGVVSYERCSFIDYVPYLNESSYNAYTPVTLIMRNCKMHIIKSNNEGIICRMCNNLDDEINSRPELAERFWPNVYIDGFELTSEKPLIGAYLFYVRNHSKQNLLINGCNKIDIKNMRYKGRFKLSNRSVKLKGTVYFSVQNNGRKTRKGISKVLQ